MNRFDDSFPQPGGTPDPFWKRAFDDAYDTPPTRVWDGVERQLDLDDADGILPLWQHRQGRQSMLFGRWAAGIAASLALALLGWWAWHREDAIRPDVAVTVAVTPAPLQTSRPANPHGPEPAIANSQRVAGKSGDLQAPLSATVRSAGRARHLISREPMMAEEGQSGPHDVTQSVEKREAQLSPAPLLAHQLASTQRQGSGNPPTTVRPDVIASVPMANEQALTAFDGDHPDQLRMRLAINELSIKPLVNRPVGNDRIVWYQSEQPVAESAAPTAKASRQHPWVSAGGGAVAFNSGLGLRPAFNSVASQYTNANTTINGGTNASPMIESQVGRAVSMQANVGMPLGEHWSVETGVGYLSSQNNVQSPVRLGTASLGIKSMTSGNLYADLMARVTGSVINADAITPNSLVTSQLYDVRLVNQMSSYDAAVHQGVNNAYQFVQVPVQVGYEFRPRRKLGLALLTGMVSNWFVRNTVADTFTVRPGDGIYRPVTLAGTAGMRLRFRPDKHWSASVAGIFQQSFQSLTKADVGMQATPQQMGLSFSIDRHF